MQKTIEIIKGKQNEIDSWLNKHDANKNLPLYSSVNIRDGGFKVASMETNLFLAGFHTLCEHGIEEAVKHIKDAIQIRFPGCTRILVITEEQTRNKWYLENIRVLGNILAQAGYDVTLATFLYTIQTPTEETVNFTEFKTATNQNVRIHSLQFLLNQIKKEKIQFDLIVVNNDLIGGTTPVFSEIHVPTYPSLKSNWHSRLKSDHFKHTRGFIHEFAQLIGCDPWRFSCYTDVVDNVNLVRDSDRSRMMDAASDLLRKIQTKYLEHKIQAKPFIHIRSDSGTSGIGVVSIGEPTEVSKLNRRGVTQFFKRRDTLVSDRYLLLEGIPNLLTSQRDVSEAIIYQISNNFVGGFYRSHGTEQNLATMENHVQQICPLKENNPACGVNYDNNILYLYRILSRIAGIAAEKEILELEGKSSV